MTKKKIEPKSKPVKAKVEPIDPEIEKTITEEVLPEIKEVDPIEVTAKFVEPIEPDVMMYNAEKPKGDIGSFVSGGHLKGITLLDKVFKFGDHVNIGKSVVPIETMGRMGAIGFMLVYENHEQAVNSFPKLSRTITI